MVVPDKTLIELFYGFSSFEAQTTTETSSLSSFTGAIIGRAVKLYSWSLTGYF
jgi:hypothetical protein